VLTNNPAAATVHVKGFHEDDSYVRERQVRAGSHRLFGVVLFTILFAATSYADTFTFSTIPPGGAISGAAGSTAGWGYTVTNNSLDQWLVFNSVNTDTAFTNGTANSSVFDFPVVAPNSTVTTNYDGISGLFEFTWDAGAPAGSFNSGNFVLSAEWWNGDPFDAVAPGEFLESIPDFSVPYSVTVPESCNCTSVPEPSSLQLLAFGISGVGALLLFNRTRKKGLGSA
jgi:PEP-CTERM motif-containing protein